MDWDDFELDDLRSEYAGADYLDEFEDEDYDRVTEAEITRFWYE